MDFNAPKSIWIKVITAVLAVGFVILIISTFVAEESAAALIFPMAIIILVFALSYYFSVTKYEISGNRIVVHRPFDSVTIPKGELTATRIYAKDIRMSIRTFGIGGVFSYTGTFWNSKFGSMTWYVTKMDNAVLLVDGRSNKTVISPDNPEKFIESLQ